MFSLDIIEKSGRCGSGGQASSRGGACGGVGVPAQESIEGTTERLPKWLKRQVPKGNVNHFTSKLIQELDLVTVCEEAKCPNRMECYSQKTATFMILGDICTRPCGFCAVSRGRPQPPEQDEPTRLAEAADRLGLEYVVLTSVTRDDLPDGGAEHFYQCTTAIREKTGAKVEVLTPDFVRQKHMLKRVVEAQPTVFNHNTETVPRLYRKIRGPRSDYRWTLRMLQEIKEINPKIKTKTGLMLGMGETHEELFDCLADILDHGCDFLTLGQYLRPSKRYLPVTRYLPPEEFVYLGKAAKSMGFKQVASGPFVRSSYHARDMAEMF
ncbi:MAG: lipoyl synthase [Pirellulaceae bacterium]|nr:lipoyl synthase [Pirellulaceae bacterium]